MFNMVSCSKTSTKNFILSITNENNPFDIFKQSYIIEPGNVYTYRVIANQIVGTDRFNAMEPVDRGCSLPHETGLLVKYYFLKPSKIAKKKNRIWVAKKKAWKC